METDNHTHELGLTLLNFIYHLKWDIESRNVYRNINDILPKTRQKKKMQKVSKSQKETVQKGNGDILIADMKTYYQAIVTTLLY